MLLNTLLVTLCVIGCTVAYQSPVFLWNVPTNAKPSLATVPQVEFVSLLKPFLKTHTIIAFVEDDLTSRDLTCHTTSTAQSCFAHLRSVSPKTYYASVESPVEALRKIAETKEYNSLDFEGKFSHPVELSAGKVIFVNFEKSNSERGATLEAHDAAIEAVSKKLTGNVVYLYLSSSNGNQEVKRMRRSTAASKTGYIFQHLDEFMIYFTKLNYTTNDGILSTELFTTSKINVIGATGNYSSYNVSLVANSGRTLDFMVGYRLGYYNISNLKFDNVLFISNELSAPLKFSYHCGNLTLKAKNTLKEPNKARLVLSDLQFQATFNKFNATVNGTFVFGNDWDCVPFFTPGILSGLFVTVFLLIITFVGICWMVDINTMDRFEDPKGKTITVNQAAE